MIYDKNIVNWFFLVEEHMHNVTVLYFLSRKKRNKPKLKTTRHRPSKILTSHIPFSIVLQNKNSLFKLNEVNLYELIGN